MSNAFLLLTTYVLNTIWQLPLLCAAGWLLARWLKPTGPELPHKIWVAVLLLATLAPATPIFRQYLARPASSSVLADAAPIVTTPAVRQVPLASSNIALPSTAIYLICGLYLAALLFFALRLGWFLHCTAALVRNAAPVSMGPDDAVMWSQSTRRFSVQRASLLSSGDVAGPVAAGFRRPVLLLPAALLQEHSRTEFLAAIGHECAHIRRDDFRKNLLYELAALLTAFHPLTWLIKSQIAQTREMVCDRMAAEQLLDRRTYSESLLQLAAKIPAAPAAAFHTIGMFDTNALEGRIMNLMISLPRVSRIRRYSLGMAATLLLLMCAVMAGSFTQPVAAQTSARKDSATKKQDLSCTYYDQGVGGPGTCGYDKQDKKKYVCSSDQDPSKNQPQIGCEWKLRRADAKK